MPSDQELRTVAEEWKQKGNEAFQKSEVDNAIQAYSQALVQVDRIIATPYILKATLLSNRAACYLKAAKLQECQEDCTTALALLDKENDTNLRAKILFRRAKSLFLQANMPHKRKDDDLQLAAKDCMSLLAFDPSNKDATQLLNAIRAQHVAETKNTHNTPLSKTLDAIKKKDDKILHNIKVLLGMLNNDTMGASMELGRLGGVQILLDLANDPSVELKPRYLCLQCLSCAGSHPPFCRTFLKEEIQDTLTSMIVKSSAVPEEMDLVVGVWFQESHIDSSGQRYFVVMDGGGSARISHSLIPRQFCRSTHPQNENRVGSTYTTRPISVQAPTIPKENQRSSLGV